MNVLHAKSIQTHISEDVVYVASSVVTSKSTTSESYCNFFLKYVYLLIRIGCLISFSAFVSLKDEVAGLLIIKFLGNIKTFRKSLFILFMSIPARNQPLKNLFQLPFINVTSMETLICPDPYHCLFSQTWTQTKCRISSDTSF